MNRRPRVSPETAWNVFRRLECLKAVERYLEQTHENPGQLLNVKAIMAGYMAPQGQDDEKHFQWDDCIEREGKANALEQSMWIEGADRAGPIPLRSSYTSPPPAVGSTLTLAVCSGTLSGWQIETAADSRAPELGYSVFHCGQGVLQVYRAVALEVDFANSDPESMRATWTNCRCAISSDLGQDGVRLLYSIGDMSLCRDMIALEAEDNEDESNEDEE
ncbi:hypothetical protein N7499_012588 [Penicillium canescens]|nr:hypothetical protein N7499_012588 [Penicillium canescens]KAJ6154597.1 hypothetical protein N7485_012966 [Penicillium canescens]